MKISDIMTPNPRALPQTDPIINAARIMRDLNVGFVPILDENNKLCGVVTDRDVVVRAITENLDLATTSIGDISSTDLHVVSPNADFNEAADIMEKFQVRRLPVVDDSGMLVGIVSLGDIAVRSKELEKAGEILEEVSEPSKPEIAA